MALAEAKNSLLRRNGSREKAVIAIQKRILKR
jgi:hypothetical protein